MSGYQAADSSDTGFGAHQGAPGSTQKRTSPWVKFGIPVVVLVVIGAVLGGVLGTQLNKHSSTNAASSPSGSSPSSLSPAQSKSAAASASSAAKAQGRFATGTDTYGLPIYPSTTNVALFSSPTLVPANNAAAAWPTDTFQACQPPSYYCQDRQTKTDCTKLQVASSYVISISSYTSEK